MSLMRSRLSNNSQPIQDMAVRGLLAGPQAIPMVRQRIYPGVAYYDTMHVLVTADGAPVVATVSGNFGQLYAVGGGRY